MLGVTYTYDSGVNGKGRRTGMTDASGSTAWSYDARGRMLSESKTLTSAGTFKTAWTYNSADLPLTMTYPGGSSGQAGEVVTYGYNSRMLLNSLTGDSNYVTSTVYDSAGRIDLRTFGNNTQTDYTYYPWTAEGGRLQYLKSGTAGSPASLQDLSYAYDAVGNIETITNTLASETNSYGYDALNRLTSWTLNGVTETYGYNSATGNLETKAGVTLQYNDAAHVHAVTSASDQSTVNSYQYDANGNQTTRVIGSDTFTLLYDAENRLVEVKKNSVSIATFVYDGDGKRVKSIIGSETTLFIGSHYEVTNGVATKYYLAGTSRIAMRKDGTLSYFLSDHLGSTSLTTDSTGSLMFEQRYKPWGETRYTTPNASAVSEYQYTGQFSDSYINLLWYGSRHYDPALGRFISPDSIVPGLDNPQAWDRFSYTFNNPVRYVDPDGHNPIPLIILLIVGAVALTADNPLPDISAPVREAINEIKGSAPTDADALVTMFTTDNLPGNTPTERLNVILDATSNGPFVHFEIDFGDSGFKDELRDPWPDTSGNQVGHFLTAVDIGYNADNYIGTGAIVGHEMYEDEHLWSTPTQLGIGWTSPSEQNLFTSGTDDAFQQILNNGWGPLENRTGNSMQDLRLSYLGWTMGKLYRQGFFTDNASVGRWLQEHIAK